MMTNDKDLNILDLKLELIKTQMERDCYKNEVNDLRICINEILAIMAELL